jgi:16S rRNA (guanine966-N2)-methyltransferase
MRIVGGMHRGRALVAPKGHSTRPTTDRTREALFNILEHAAWSRGLRNLRVLDLFAGSGALGLEALSRGAAFCLFVDNAPSAQAIITGNLARLALQDRAELAGWDATRLDQRSAPSAAFDLAFLDPPYGQGLVERALAGMASAGWLAQGAIVVVERGADEADLHAPDYEVLDRRGWGAARVCFLASSSPST